MVRIGRQHCCELVDYRLNQVFAGIVGPSPNTTSPRRHQREISLLVMIVQMRCTANLRPPILFIAGAGVCLVATEPAFL